MIKKMLLWVLVLPLVLFSCTEDKANKTLPNLAKGGDFTLPTTTGEAFTLSKSNHWTMLYFGYTMCPDACPLTLSKIGQVEMLLEKQGNKNLIDKFMTVFVTVDPKRDTPERLAAYLSYFPVHALGLIGSEEQLATIANMYNVEYKMVDTGSASGYAVDHTTSIFLVDPKGKLRYVFSYNASSKKITKLLKTFIE